MDSVSITDSVPLLTGIFRLSVSCLVLVVYVFLRTCPFHLLSNLLAYNYTDFIMPFILVTSIVISTVPFLTLLVFSPFYVACVAKGLSVVIIFSKN